MLEILAVASLFVVINKPGGLLAVPGREPEMQDCVVTRVKTLFPDCIPQPAVLQLDMDTSGLMVVARTGEAHRHLCRQVEKQLVEKRYVALVDGIFTGPEGDITPAFRLDPDNRPHQLRLDAASLAFDHPGSHRRISWESLPYF